VVGVESLAFAYEEARVLDVEGLEVAAGDVAILTGHNGSGKTTLLKVVNGLLPPAGGTVRLWGEPITSARGRNLLRTRSVLVHQKPYLFHESVASNIRYVLKIREPEAPDIEERIEESLAAVRLEGFADRRATGLSGGEKQRVAIARALSVRPDLLILDEPTSNIDPESVRAIESALRRANRAGTTILMTTHNVATAYRLASKVVPMAGGRLLGDPNNVFHGRVRDIDEYFAYFAVRNGNAGGPSHAGGQEPVIRAPARAETAEAAVVPMDDIIVSRERIHSSAQNHFEGRVIAIVPYEHGRRVDVDCGGIVLSTIITPYAIEQLDLERGSEVHLAFKASAVRLY
jgi:tungstate transport system ATP-binding protein